MSRSPSRARAEPPAGLRVMIYDRSCRGRALLPGLTHAWWAGGALFSRLGRFDAWFGAHTWSSALAWLADIGGAQTPIAEIQYWGHGKWGRVYLNREPLNIDALTASHPHHAMLRKIRARTRNGDGRGLWWFRTCETLGAASGQRFAQGWSEFFNTRVAGHTYIIGPWQSGLHSVAPGELPRWSDREGLAEGDPEHPVRALWSRRRAPNTIYCLTSVLPRVY